MGYIAGIFAIGPVIGAVILLLYGLVTDPIATILFVVVGIPAALLMVFLFFTGRFGCFAYCTVWDVWMEIGMVAGSGI